MLMLYTCELRRRCHTGKALPGGNACVWHSNIAQAQACINVQAFELQRSMPYATHKKHHVCDVQSSTEWG